MFDPIHAAMECLSENAHRLWFLKELGLGSSSHFCEAIEDLAKMQSVEGYFFSGRFNHSGPSRVLVAIKPESEALSSGKMYPVVLRISPLVF